MITPTSFLFWRDASKLVRVAILAALSAITSVQSRAATDMFVQFTPYNGGSVPVGDSQDQTFNGAQGWFVVKSFSFGATQVLNIGSQSSGAGAGKVSFSPLNLQKSVNSLSPTLFQYAAAGTPYEFVTLVLRTSANGSTAAATFPYLKVTFKLVAVNTINWSVPSNASDCSEAVGFEYGGTVLTYTSTQADGTAGSTVTGGWNVVKNIQDTTLTPIGL
jgi:type VI protein secretion system component Hcp